MWLAACIPNSLGGLERLRQGASRHGAAWFGAPLEWSVSNAPAGPNAGQKEARCDKDLYGWCCSLLFLSLRVPDLCPSRHNATNIHGN